MIDDFTKDVLGGMGLKGMIEYEDQKKAVRQMLEMIESIEKIPPGKEVILADRLIAAMKLAGYEDPGVKAPPNLPNLNFDSLDLKSIRILNRLARLACFYQSKYQDQAKEGVNVSM